MATRVEEHEIARGPEPRLYRGRALADRRRISEVSAEAERFARALGWFSVGLGVAEVAIPRTVARFIGSRNGDSVLRAFGLREIATGAAILARPRWSPLLWARVGGDAVDLAYLGGTMAARGTDRAKTGAALAAVAGVTALDVLCAAQLAKGVGRSSTRARASVIVDRPPEECYRFWRNLENLPRFMAYLQSVSKTGENRSHWVARTPGGVRIEWDSEQTYDAPNERIEWRSLPGSDISISGVVRFEPAPGGRGTIVRVEMEHSYLGQIISRRAARLVGKDPEQLIEKDLRRFKQVMETGEVITTEGQPAGRRGGTTWLDAIAR